MVFDGLIEVLLLLCYYCLLKFGDPESAISHFSSNHETELLRYRQLVLCPDSGHMKYQTKLHKGLVPRQLHDVGKVKQVRNEEVLVYDSKLKKKKLNTPVKGKKLLQFYFFCSKVNTCIQGRIFVLEQYIYPSFIVQKFLQVAVV